MKTYFVKELNGVGGGELQSIDLETKHVLLIGSELEHRFLRSHILDLPLPPLQDHGLRDARKWAGGLKGL